VKKFGADTLRVIEEEPRRLREVLGIGVKKAAIIELAWQQQKAIKNVMIFLQGHGVSTGLAVKIYKQYGNLAEQIVTSDPYRLARDIYGIGFKTADKIARQLGLPTDAPTRVEAGVAYALSELSEEGHVYSPMTGAGGAGGVPVSVLLRRSWRDQPAGQDDAVACLVPGRIARDGFGVIDG
jgi:exodeoxyribonuclease V alpha subunit